MQMSDSTSPTGSPLSKMHLTGPIALIVALRLSPVTRLKITIKVGNRLYDGDVSHKPEIGV